MSDISGTTATSNQPTAVLPAGDTASASSASSSTSDGLGSNGVNADTFLKLLVARSSTRTRRPRGFDPVPLPDGRLRRGAGLGSLQTSLASLVSSPDKQARPRPCSAKR